MRIEFSTRRLLILSATFCSVMGVVSSFGLPLPDGMFVAAVVLVVLLVLFC